MFFFNFELKQVLVRQSAVSSPGASGYRVTLMSDSDVGSDINSDVGSILDDVSDYFFHVECRMPTGH